MNIINTAGRPAHYKNSWKYCKGNHAHYKHNRKHCTMYKCGVRNKPVLILTGVMVTVMVLTLSYILSDSCSFRACSKYYTRNTAICAYYFKISFTKMNTDTVLIRILRRVHHYNQIIIITIQVLFRIRFIIRSLVSWFIEL